MKNNRAVIVFDVANGQADVYRDVGAVAEILNMPRTTLQSKLNVGTQYIDGRFVGIGVIHKSGRGGDRR